MHFFCQRHIPKLKTNCPADSKLADVGVGYRILCETVAAFIRLGHKADNPKHSGLFESSTDGTAYHKKQLMPAQ